MKVGSGERVPVRENRMGKGSLRGRELRAFKEVNKGQCGWSPGSKAEEGEGTGSQKFWPVQWLPSQWPSAVYLDRRKKHAGHGWQSWTLTFSFQGVPCPFGKQDPFDLRPSSPHSQPFHLLQPHFWKMPKLMWAGALSLTVHPEGFSAFPILQPCVYTARGSC